MQTNPSPTEKQMYFYHLSLLSRMPLQKKGETHQLWALQTLDDVDLTASAECSVCPQSRTRKVLPHLSWGGSSSWQNQEIRSQRCELPAPPPLQHWKSVGGEPGYMAATWSCGFHPHWVHGEGACLCPALKDGKNLGFYCKSLRTAWRSHRGL